MTTNLPAKAQPSIMVREIAGQPLTFRADGWLDMTSTAEAFGKRVTDFLRSAAYRTAETSIRGADLVSAKFTLTETIKGHGSHCHPLLVADFLRWCSPRFHTLTNAMIYDLITGAGKHTTVDPERSLLVKVAASDIPTLLGNYGHHFASRDAGEVGRIARAVGGEIVGARKGPNGNPEPIYMLPTGVKLTEALVRVRQARAEQRRKSSGVFSLEDFMGG